ncbi:MAG: preprotein translocase subunit SecF [Frankiales bacterium]|jgi:preprotein translocase subunit SecF|nr:preprotein translocase subunit SecF [Frankiales bacterium]
MAKESFGARLYRGEKSYDIVGRRRRWYTASGVIIVISLASLLFRGLNLGIEFKGGVLFNPPANGHSVGEARDCVIGAGVAEAVVQEVNDGKGNKQLRIQTPALTAAQVSKVEDALVKCLDVSRADLSPQEVGASWGKDISKRALEALIVFLLVVALFLSLYFESKLAAAALIALFHDLVITAGVYSVLGFEVTPATVIGLLTILGYSLYDTVVVFDKVRENTMGLAGRSTMTYSYAANLAVNQTLVRSINTSVIALLPVAGLLFIGAGVLGAGTLEELSLALFVGIASGAYSSIFIATPIAASLKEREPQFQALTKRVAARQSGSTTTYTGALASPTVSKASATALLEREDEADEEPTRSTAAAATRPAQRPAGAPRRQQPRKKSGGKGNRGGGRPGGRKKR